MKFTPAMMMFGQELRLPLDYNVPGLVNAESDDVADDGERLVTRMQQFVEINKIRDEDLSNSKSAQLKQKQRYDIKHAAAGPTLEVGEELLMKNACRQQRKGDKQQPLYSGPFLIEEILDSGAMRVKGRKNVVAVTNVKRYFRADQSKKLGEAKEAGQIEAEKRAEDANEAEEVEDTVKPDELDEEIQLVDEMVEELADCELPYPEVAPKPTRKRTQMLSLKPDDSTIQFAPVDRNWQKARAASLNFRMGKTLFKQPVAKNVSRFAKPQQIRSVNGMLCIFFNFEALKRCFYSRRRKLFLPRIVLSHLRIGQLTQKFAKSTSEFYDRKQKRNSTPVQARRRLRCTRG